MPLEIRKTVGMVRGGGGAVGNKEDSRHGKGRGRGGAMGIKSKTVVLNIVGQSRDAGSRQMEEQH